MRNPFKNHSRPFRRVSFTLASVFLFWLGTAGSTSVRGPVADFILLNGKIVTADKDNTIAQAVAVISGRIIAIGTSEDIRPLIGEKTVVVDVHGKTVVPGLFDAHGHHVSTARSDAQTVDLSLEAGVKSIADIQKKIAERAIAVPKGARISGVKEDDFRLLEKRHPTRQELDKAAPDHPVEVSTVGGHFSVFNSKALELAGVTKDTPDPDGGKFGRDPATGELTGWAYDKATGVVSSKLPPLPVPSAEENEAAVRRLFKELVSVGITTINNTAGPTDIRTILELQRKGEQIVRFRADITGQAGMDAESGIGMTYRGLGDEWVKITGMKFFMDGAISARTAYVSESYLNQPGFYGVLATTKETATKMLTDAYARGLRLIVHANGDAAINMYLDILENLQKKYPRPDPRNVDIHCSVVSPQIVDRIKRLGVVPTIFGAYAYYHGDKLIPAFGEKRLEWMFAAKAFLDAGIKVSGHSDYSASPFAPMMAMHALVNRVTSGGKPIGRSQKIPVMDALRMYTINAAYESFDDQILGSLELGKFGDMVVLGKDLLTEPPETILNTPVDMTIVGGKVVFERK